MPAVRRLAGALRPEIEQPSAIVAKLREEEAAAVADFRIVHAELMAVIAKRQRLGEVVGQRFKAAEMPRPSLVEMQPDALGPTLIQKTWCAIGEPRRLDRIVEFAAERQECRIGPITAHRG